MRSFRRRGTGPRRLLNISRKIGRVESGEVDLFIDPTEFSGVDQAIEAVEILRSGKNIDKAMAFGWCFSARRGENWTIVQFRVDSLR